jgi:hypothetical protein
MADSQRPTALYNISGEARAEFKLFDLRDRIRNGTLSPQDQIAIVGTDLWKPASDFPELRRYFSLLKPAAAPGAAPATAAQAPAASMGRRIIGGVVYPFTAITSIVVIIAAALLLRPRFEDLAASALLFVCWNLASVYALGVIRKSSEGQTTAPSAAEVGGIAEWIVSFFRVISVTLICAWPVMAASILAFTGLVRSFALLQGIATVVVLLYYPASLATVAIWKSIRISLSIQQIFRLIGILGIDYFAVIAVWLVLFFGITLSMPLILLTVVKHASALTVTSIRLLVPIKFGALTWSNLYASHLLGWAVYRHRDEL